MPPEGGMVSPSRCAAGLPWIEMPVRFHLLSSSIESLNATLSEAQLRATLAEAQAYLDQACVKVRVERVVRDEVGAERERRFARRTPPPPPQRPECPSPGGQPDFAQ